MVKVGVEDNKMRDGFRRDIELIEMVQKRISNRADPAFDDGIGLPSNEIKVKEFASQEGDMVGNLKWQLHKISLTHCF